MFRNASLNQLQRVIVLTAGALRTGPGQPGNDRNEVEIKHDKSISPEDITKDDSFWYGTYCSLFLLTG